MLEEYVGAIVLEVDGREIEVTDLDVQINTGRKLVKTMNKTGRAKGYTAGIATYDLSLSVVIPLDGDLDWGNLVGVKLTQYPVTGKGGRRTSYLDCFTTEVGAKYTVDNEAKRDIKMSALREVIE
ncbi:phage tail protein [Xenorhabdus miraniensis]|uniref:Phage tail protein n=1 Tax=Xenorhabdus miraniensis TaxID=351674 RepID=A0A2D0JLC5_9GAMM|nr:phage tail protein [Xenorhabdus miraniensis]PHM47087.1 phage tail protein [Xenorhabdus miraniensis]